MSKILTFKGKNTPFGDHTFILDADDTLLFEADVDRDLVLQESTVASFERNLPSLVNDWDNQELADIYRVKRLLSAAGVVCEIDRGTTDEGDPWCIFCDSQGDVFIHFCRIDGQYLLDSPSIERPLRGHDFNSLVSDFTNRAVPRTQSDGLDEAERRVIHFDRSGKIRLHPSALLAALIWTLFLASEELVLIADLDESDADHEGVPGRIDSGLDGVAGKSEVDANVFDPSDDISTAGLEFGPQEQTDIIYDGVGSKQTDFQTKDTHAQQSIVIANNAHVVGLSAIAIAAGLMTERIWNDNRDQFLTYLNEESFEALNAKAADFENSETHTQLNLSVFDKLLSLALPEELKDDLTILRDTALATWEAATIVASNNQVVYDNLHGQVDVKESDVGIGVEVLQNRPEALPDNVSNLLITSLDLPNLNGQDSSRKEQVSEDDPELGTYNLSDFVGNVLSSWNTPLNEVSINDISVYTSMDFGSFDQKTTEQLVSIVSPSEVIVSSVPPVESGQTDQGDNYSGQLLDFDFKAKLFFGELISRRESIELIFIDEDLILIDRSAFTAAEEDTYSMRWELSDGRTIGTLGMRSDFEAYDLIA